MPELDIPHGQSLRSAVDRQIIDQLQGDFPLCERPYAPPPNALVSAKTNCWSACNACSTTRC